MSNKSIFLLFFLISFSVLNATNSELGELTITIDEIDVQLYNIQNALLYKNVLIEYDSTVLIQNDEGNRILVYPQLREGNNNVLRLIIGEIQESNRNFFERHDPEHMVLGLPSRGF